KPPPWRRCHLDPADLSPLSLGANPKYPSTCTVSVLAIKRAELMSASAAIHSRYIHSYAFRPSRLESEHPNACSMICITLRRTLDRPRSLSQTKPHLDSDTGIAEKRPSLTIYPSFGNGWHLSVPPFTAFHRFFQTPLSDHHKTLAGTILRNLGKDVLHSRQEPLQNTMPADLLPPPLSPRSYHSISCRAHLGSTLGVLPPLRSDGDVVFKNPTGAIPTDHRNTQKQGCHRFVGCPLFPFRPIQIAIQGHENPDRHGGTPLDSMQTKLSARLCGVCILFLPQPPTAE
ncbi:hypothetical protein IAQ61_006726, partial [Plenodomus lingam]|uniref:uncharacterized protein n=1 Tax=Leptosphaeria maculans TaxID=5022 RepID=UPI00332460B5